MSGFPTGTWIYPQTEGGQSLILSHSSEHIVVVTPPPEKWILDAISLPEDGESLYPSILLCLSDVNILLSNFTLSCLYFYLACL